MARQPTCWARGALELLDYAAGRGCNAAELRAAAQLEETQLHDPDARILVARYCDLLEAAAQATRDPLFGLHYMEGVTPEAIGPIGFLAMSCATIGEAIERIVRYHRVMTEGDRFEVRVDKDVVTFSLTNCGRYRPAHDHITEMHAFDCLVLSAQMTGTAVEILRFDVRHQRRGSRREYERIFGVVPRFGMPHNQWSIPRAVLDRPLPRADAALVRFFESFVAAMARDLPAESTAAAAYRAVAQLCDGQGISAERAAQRLAMSPRTLHRRLSTDGVSLRQIIEAVRRERALEMLANDLPISEIAWILGFSEPRAFFRAFRRWTRTTPQAWRQQQATGGTDSAIHARRVA